MIIEKDLSNNDLYFVNENDIILRTNHIGAEFVIIKSTDRPIIITKNDDKYLYNNLLWLLNNKYVFDNNELSYMANDKIVWFSDQTCDIENEEETKKIDRMILEKSNKSIIINCYNPFCEKNNIKKSQSVISFSPSGNGFYSKNLLNNNNTFQDDFIISILRTINNEYIKQNEVMGDILVKKYIK